MRRCILHIGMPKTGTSSIQESLRNFADDRFVWYDDHEGRTNHTSAIFGLVGAVKPDKSTTWNAENFNPDTEYPIDYRARETFDEALSALGERTLVVSGEGIGLLPASRLEDLAAYFHSRGVEKIEIVGYVRPPVEYVTSLARARKGGMLRSFNLGRRSTGYRNNFEKFDPIFGRENVHFWKFEPRSFPSGCVVRDFCTKLGVDFPQRRIVRANDSLPREAVCLLYTYHKFGRDLGSQSLTPPQRLRLVEGLADIGHTPLRFSLRLLRPVIEKNRADIEWMEARLGEPLCGDMGDEKPSDVREEWDLLRPDPGLVAKLRERLGKEAPPEARGETPREVALLVHALRGEATAALSQHKVQSGPGDRMGESPVLIEDTQMRVSHLIEEIERTDPTSLDGISKEQAERLVKALFKSMRETLGATPKGAMSYAGLGEFRIRKVEREVDGETTTRIRIGFHPEA